MYADHSEPSDNEEMYTDNPENSSESNQQIDQTLPGPSECFGHSYTEKFSGNASIIRRIKQEKLEKMLPKAISMEEVQSKTSPAQIDISDIEEFEEPVVKKYTQKRLNKNTGRQLKNISMIFQFI